MDLGDTRWSVMGWIHVAQDMNEWQILVKTVMNFRVP
jgi:hypothetical protein